MDGWEVRTTAVREPVRGRAPARPPRRNKAVQWLTTTDHKQIGTLYLVSAFVFFLIGGLMA
ncbi:cytochrome ubiquinol oxidase subunit I, partial [Streptomyces noursei]